jgi:hypothetical protein
MITLSQALKEDRLSEFIAQAEAHGLDPANYAEFDVVIRTALKVAPDIRDEAPHGRRRQRSKIRSEEDAQDP